MSLSLKQIVARQRAEELASYERALEVHVAAAAEKLKAEQAA
jgi:hypothetical protein